MKPEDILSPCLPTNYRGTQSRAYRDGKGRFLKYCQGGRPAGIKFEADILQELAESICFPDVYEVGSNYILMEDLGDGEEITNLEVVMRHACTALEDMRKIGVHHNDLESSSNIVVRANVPCLVDFGRATRGDPRPGAYPDYILLLSLARRFMQGRAIAELVNK